MGHPRRSHLPVDHLRVVQESKLDCQSTAGAAFSDGGIVDGLPDKFHDPTFYFTPTTPLALAGHLSFDGMDSASILSRRFYARGMDGRHQFDGSRGDSICYVFRK